MGRVKNFLKKSSLIRSAYHAVRQNPFVVHTRMFQNMMASRYFAGVTHHYDSRRELGTEHRVCYFRGRKSEQIARMLSMIRIKIEPHSRFQCWIDEYLFTVCAYRIIDNMPPDYELIVMNSTDSLIETFSAVRDNRVAEDNVIILKAVNEYIDRIVHELETTKSDECIHSAEIFRAMKSRPAQNFEEALQRILLWSSIFWQSHHRLVGLGRLDKMLSNFIEGTPGRERIEMIKDFCDSLHKHYGFKSNGVAKGDTGQIIILGGTEPDGKYFVNELTYDFIHAFIEHRLPDPKLLLRSALDMPEDLLNLSVECIATGVGCPLISNDSVVIPALEEFGYSHEDACNYVTSACWEPLAYGKSLEQNNIGEINYAKVISDMYSDKSFTGINDWDGIISLYKGRLMENIRAVCSVIDGIKWEEDPLMSMFTRECINRDKDISQGGAVYNDYGILTVGMSNAINSLLNIKHMMNESVSPETLKKAALGNYPDESLRTALEAQKYFGHDDEEVILLTKELVEFSAECLKDYRNFLGGRAKFGLSSPNYVETGKNTPATLDGRRAGEALGVHISNPKGVPYTELIMFASNLNYSGIRSNGNVLDYFVSPAIINRDSEKFSLFMKQALRAGFFQMQMNVVNSEQLIDAKKNPGKYPDLIVRVWGFSAYFDELPEEYKDVLIERALSCEGLSA